MDGKKKTNTKKPEIKEEVLQKFTKRQQNFLKALVDTGGNITAACMKTGIKSRQTVYGWMKNEAFKAEVEAINEASLDYVESKLMTAIQNDNITAIIFYLKTKGKKRGYIETIENQINTNPFQDLMQKLDDEEEKKK